MNKETSTPLRGPTAAPDFKQVRKFLKDISERERLGEYIKAGWSPEELGEYARSIYLHRGKTYPTALSYQVALSHGPDSQTAKLSLAHFRKPGFVMPPFNRPNPPPPLPWEHPDNPEHSEETRADVAVIARCLRSRSAEWGNRPPPDPEKPIPPSLWVRCFRMRERYASLDKTLLLEGLKGYR